MNSRNARFDPRKVLDSDWRKRVWKRWLLRTLTDAADTTAPDTCKIPSHDTSAQPIEETTATIAPPPMPAQLPPAGCESHREALARRGQLRVRFDALFDRIAAVEDTLEALGKRFTLTAAHARRKEQRLFERLESEAELLERQTLAIEAIQAMLGRLEQRLERLERRTRHDVGESEHSEPREAHAVPPSGVDNSDFSDLEDAFGEEPATCTRSVPPEPVEGSPFSGSSIHGNLSEMSLPTVLAVLELERRTGLLRVCSDDGHILTATLRTGSIVGAKRREIDADPVEVIREAMRFKNGHIWFRQSGIEAVSGSPRSVGSVLLEATSRNDEAARTG